MCNSCAMGLSNLDRSQVTSIGDAQRAPHALAGAAAGTRSCLAAPLKLWEGRATGIVGFASAQRLRCANTLESFEGRSVQGIMHSELSTWHSTGSSS